MSHDLEILVAGSAAEFVDVHAHRLEGGCKTNGQFR